MNLYNDIYKIKAINSSKEMKLIDIIAIILEYIKEKAIENIISSCKGLEAEYKYNEENKKIRWVLTIPAIWKDKNKNIMMESAEKAGLISTYGNEKKFIFCFRA